MNQSWFFPNLIEFVFIDKKINISRGNSDKKETTQNSD